jgi:type II secretory pathway pseudopilin PulG
MKETYNRNNNNKSSTNNGFTLIITISMMMLIVMISLGFLSLSSVVIRQTGHSAAMSVARSNARLALMMAISELQREAGPDQRITARSSILDTDPKSNKITGVTSPSWLGVWNAHTEWLNPEGGTNLIANTYTKGRESSFRRWLVSSENTEDLTNFKAATGEMSSKAVVMLPRDQQGNPQVLAGLLRNPSGAHAWWIQGENQKFHIGMQDSAAADDSAKVVARNFPLTANLPIVGIAKLSDEKTLKLASIETLELASEINQIATTDGEGSACMTVDSLSVLTNVRKGGLKTDFNLAMELKTLPPQLTSKALRDETASTLPKPQYSTGINFPSWYKLSQFYRQQSQLSDGGGLDKNRHLTSSHYWSPGNLNATGYDRTPITTRAMIMMFAHKKAGSVPNTSTYLLGLNPVLVVWNPYSMQLNCPRIAFFVYPYSLEYRVYKNNAAGSWSKLPTAQHQVSIASTFSLSAGETRIFSAANGTTSLIPGFRSPNTGAGFDVSPAELQDVPNATSVEIALRMSDQIGQDFNGGKFQLYWTMTNADDNGQRFNEMALNPCEPGKPMPIIEDKNGERVILSTMGIGSRTNIANFQFILKTAEDLRNPAPYNMEDLRCKNFLHADPTTNRAMYGTSVASVKKLAQYMFWVQRGTGNALNPDWDPKTNRAYFGSGISTASGQSVVPLIEISPVAITSLAALRHFKLGLGRTAWSSSQHNWELAANQAQGFANSFAHPMIPSKGIYANAPETANLNAGLQFKLIADQWDRAFLCNDGLWDDWFCSGIANQSLGPYAGKARPKQLVSDWLNYLKPLPNEQLLPYFYGAHDVNYVTSRILNGNSPASNSWREAARYMMLRGGFNINSTSVEAWKLFLSSSAGGEFIYQGPRGPATAKIPEQHVLLSRHAVPVAAGEGAGPQDPLAWTGVRFLSPPQIGKLAEECVHQVKLRGPFLNLSDFINRRLSTDELALCGALQAAIDWDEYNGNSPFPSDPLSINGRFKQTQDYINEPMSGARFPAAGKGSRHAGIPGYVTQGDLLAKIGNQIVVRDDTFRIKAYGEAHDTNGNIIARAWCTAVLQRLTEYMDQADRSESTFLTLKSPINKRFGRRFSLLQFQWL